MPDASTRLARRALATLLIAASAMVGLAPPALAARPEALVEEPPNIVVILLDDIGAYDGTLWQFLPSIKRTFLDQGVTFSGFHVETPLCCPGRAGYLTGLHTHNHGVTQNEASLFDPSMTIATELQDAGYWTAMTGKYFNNYKKIAPSVPPGWDVFHGFNAAQSHGYYYNYTLWSNGGSPVTYGTAKTDYFADVIKAKVVADLRAAPPSKPIFSWIGVTAPHGPKTPAPRHASDPRCSGAPPYAPANYNERDVSDKPAYVRNEPRLSTTGAGQVLTCRTLLSIDQILYSVRKELNAQGRLANTLIVLTSDNGMNLGAHRLGSKLTPYATQVPFFVSWPAVLGTQPRTIERRLSNIDLAPTLCELVGCSLGPYDGGQAKPDGESFAELLLGTGPGPDRDALLESLPEPIAGSKFPIPGWYGLATTASSPFSSAGCAAPGDCRWHYVEYETGERELYDVSGPPCWAWQPGDDGDPCELENLAGRAEYQILEEGLSARLAALKAE